MRRIMLVFSLVAGIISVSSVSFVSIPTNAQGDLTATPGEAVCGNGICEEAEVADENLCPQDCTGDNMLEDLSGIPQGVPTEPGRYERVIEHDGRLRLYLIAIPQSYMPDTFTPLVFVFHGSGQTAHSFASRHEDLFTKAEEEGIILVFPQSTILAATNRTAWIASLTPNSDYNEPDDVAFVLELLATLQESLAIDAAHIYATGFSSGGVFTHLLGAVATGTFAAIAPVAASLGTSKGTDTIEFPPEPAGAMPIMIVNGRRDPARPYDGGPNHNGTLVASVQEAVDFWMTANECALPPMTETRQNEMIIIDLYTECAEDAEVVLVTLERMVHVWPDADDGYNFDANNVIIEFFKRHAR